MNLLERKFADVAEWQTRLFKGQVGNRGGSTPLIRTKKLRFGVVFLF